MKATDFFSRNAEAYSKSVSHARGRDLERLMSDLRLGGSERALDVATGTGFTAAALASHSSEVLGVDANSEMLTQARKLTAERGLSNLDFLLGSAESLPLSDTSVDVVTCRRAAHHFRSKEAFLLEAGRVLKQGGKIGIVDMVPHDGFGKEYNELERTRDTTHVFAEETESWRSMLVSCGFRVSRCEVQEERVSFDGWIYPLDPSGSESAACRRLLLGATREFASAIELDGDLAFTKRRMILTGNRQSGR